MNVIDSRGAYEWVDAYMYQCGKYTDRLSSIIISLMVHSNDVKFSKLFVILLHSWAHNCKLQRHFTKPVLAVHKFTIFIERLTQTRTSILVECKYKYESQYWYRVGWTSIRNYIWPEKMLINESLDKWLRARKTRVLTLISTNFRMVWQIGTKTFNDNRLIIWIFDLFPRVHSKHT